MEYKHQMYKRLQSLRERQNLSCRRLGEILGVGGSIVAKWCKGTRVPSRRNIKKICEHFKVEPAWLIYGIDSSSSALMPNEDVSDTLAVDAHLAFAELTKENKKAVLALTKVLLSKQKKDDGGCVNGN